MHALLGLEDLNELSGHPVVGPSWEGFVIENLLATAPTRTAASFYRTAAGAEIDLVLEVPRRGRWAIEVKRGLGPRLDKGFHIACDDLEPARRFVVYSGDERYAIDAATEVIGVRDLARELAGERALPFSRGS